MLKVIFNVFIFCLCSSAVYASNYPADYSTNYSCENKGSVEVCRAIQVGNRLAVLDIRYKGPLRQDPTLKVWIKVRYTNGDKVAVFKMVPSNHEAMPAYARITGGCLVGKLGGCEINGTVEMRDLLIWAQRFDGTLNALDLEVAFFTDNEWDNNGAYGVNYSFQFPEKEM